MEKQELQTTTKPVSLATLQPDVLGRDLIKVRSTRDALAIVDNEPDKYPAIPSLRAKFGAEKVEAVIKLHLIDLCENVNLKRPLRDAQVDNIAREIVSEYYYLTIADVHVIFRNAKTGVYGEFYESLDMPKVMTWFREYFKDRCSLAEQDSISGRFRDSNDPRSQELARMYLDKLEKQSKMKK